ncbi:MAG: DMT family transporter [Ignavibacteriales bacterium]|nr:DMT family transporter [Ignavibacteriales bacterium]
MNFQLNPVMVYIILLFQSLIASGTHIVAKIVVRDIEPVTLTMVRSVMAAVGLLVIAAVRKTNFRILREHYVSIGLLSALAIPINQFLFLTGIKYTTPANASLLYGTTPAIVLLVSHFIGKEKMTWKKSIGVAIAFCGILLVVFERGIDFRSDYTFGNGLLVIAVLAWSFYTVLGKQMIMKYGAFPTSAITMILGTVMFLPIGIIRVVDFNFSSLTMNHWMGLLYLSLGTSIFAYFLWYYALGKIEASKVAIFTNLQPILTTILAVVILGQTITTVFILGEAPRGA